VPPEPIWPVSPAVRLMIARAASPAAATSRAWHSIVTVASSSLSQRAAARIRRRPRESASQQKQFHGTAWTHSFAAQRNLDWRPGRVYFLTFLEPSRDDRSLALTARSASRLPP